MNKFYKTDNRYVLQIITTLFHGRRQLFESYTLHSEIKIGQYIFKNSYFKTLKNIFINYLHKLLIKTINNVKYLGLDTCYKYNIEL